MERKRSKGVTFWAWTFMLMGVMGIVGHAATYRDQIRLLGFGFVAVTGLSEVAYVFCGFWLLKLSESARRAAIYLGLISILSIPFGLVGASKSFELPGDVYARQERMIAEQINPEHQQAAREHLQKAKEQVKASVPVVLGVLGILLFIGELVPIHFFTRPVVKAQFVG